jgi:hypothetical protein
MENSSRETVAITESIYFVRDHSADWRRCSRDQIHLSQHRLDSNSKSLKANSPIKSIQLQQQIGLCNISAKQTNLLRWPLELRLRHPNVSYVEIPSNIHNIDKPIAKKGIINNTSCKASMKTICGDR